MMPAAYVAVRSSQLSRALCCRLLALSASVVPATYVTSTPRMAPARFTAVQCRACHTPHCTASVHQYWSRSISL